MQQSQRGAPVPEDSVDPDGMVGWPNGWKTHHGIIKNT